MKKQPSVSISILSGKGGVGKSNLTLNIGCALNRLGEKVLLMDCDMGLANMDVLLGIAPDAHIQDILLSGKAPSEVLVPLEEERGSFDLLPANSGMAEFTDLDAGARSLMCERVNPLADNYDFLLLDIGAGISPTALSFAAMSRIRLVVVTPEPTSLTDSYALMKVLSTRYNITNFHVVVNQVESKAEGELTYKRLAAVCQRFLGFAPIRVGDVRADKSLAEAVRKQKLLLRLHPHAPAAVDCMSIAAVLRSMRTEMLRSPQPEAALCIPEIDLV